MNPRDAKETAKLAWHRFQALPGAKASTAPLSGEQCRHPRRKEGCILRERFGSPKSLSARSPRLATRRLIFEPLL
jgi:hypothetical protein